MNKDILYRICEYSSKKDIIKFHNALEENISPLIVEMMIKRPKIMDLDFDYLIIQCGYTGRFENVDLEKYECDEEYQIIKFLYTYDTIWGAHRGLRLSSKKESHAIANEIFQISTKHKSKIYNNGTVVYQCGNWISSGMYILQKLMNLNHCAFFDFESVSNMKIISDNGIKILYLSFDTESG